MLGVEDNEAMLSCESIGSVVPASWSWTDGNGTNLSQVGSKLLSAMTPFFHLLL